MRKQLASFLYHRTSPILRRLGYQIKRIDYSSGSAFQYQKQLIAKPQVIFDVGAHHGETVAEYRRLFGEQPKIYSFEPYPASYQKLLSNTAHYPNLQCFELGLAATSGQMRFYSNKSDATNSLLSFDAEEVKRLELGDTSIVQTIEQVEVPVDTVDNFCKKNSIQQIDILKMDVQGAELAVLQGAKQLLAMGAVKLVYAEVAFTPTYQQQPLFHHIASFLEGYSFRCFGLYDLIHSRNEKLVAADALFLRD